MNQTFLTTWFSLTFSVTCVAMGSEQPRPVVIKKIDDHVAVNSPFCGELRVVSTAKDNPKVEMAIAIDIGTTRAHFHKTFEEIYAVMDGSVTVELYDPSSDKFSTVTLNANEIVMIPAGVHHRISAASEKNRLQVVCVPGFNADDEHPSHKLNS